MKYLPSFKFLGSAFLAAAVHLESSACGGDYGIKSTLKVHEWGTFTSVQGADGEQMNWHPLASSDLPPFVYNVWNPSSVTNHNLDVLFGKSTLSARQRMETPVLYFYSPTEQMVNVQVNFPDGKMTEWFPEAAKWGNLKRAGNSQTNLPPEGILAWNTVTVLGTEAAKENEAKIPSEKSGSHYYAARDVQANLLKVKNASGKDEFEKFLFYRGVAQFHAPLRVTIAPESRYLQVENRGSETLHDLIVLNIQGKEGKHLTLGDLKPKEKREIAWPDIESGRKPLSSVQTDVYAKLHTALTRQGLFDKEATSMINTWHESWLSEQGLRVLYVLPEQWTERTLPLKVTPAPQEIERVMVGRAEVITPQMEWSLMQQLVKFSSGHDAAKQSAVKECMDLGMGRFTEPALSRIVGANPSPELNKYRFMFMDAVKRAEKNKTTELKKVITGKEANEKKLSCTSVLDFGNYDIFDWLNCGC